MMTPTDHRAARGDHPAVVMAGGSETITYRELDDRSMRLARRLRAHGLRPGGRVAVLLENHPRWFEILWATQRCGLYFVPINWHLDPAETAVMVEHSRASALITSAALGDVVRSLGARRLADVTLRLVVDGDLPGYERYEDAIASHPATPLAVERQGEIMFYSAGTTGRPKALLPPLTGSGYGERPNVLAALFQAHWGFGADTVLLTVGPLYHAGPTGFAAAVQRLGGTVVLVDDFDPRRVLEVIEERQVTHVLLFPMHFDGLLALDAVERSRHDLSSLRVVVHGAGPCSVDVKERMIDWFGKIVHEYYVGAEGNAFTLVTPEDWVEHKGTVGKLLTGTVHVLDADGRELPPGEIGQVWFETGAQFAYHDDPDATAAAVNDRGWSTLGDAGWVDADGFLFIVDRAADAIDVGGETVYPRVVEEVLTAHPAVADAAVVGLDGRVHARVRLGDGVDVAALDEHCRANLPSAAWPASIEVVERLPRLPTGKLLKRRLAV